MKSLENFRMVAVAIVCLAVLPMLGAAAEKPEKDGAKPKVETLTLKVNGVECAKCATVITAALNTAGIKVVGTMQPNPSGPAAIEVTCPATCDLGAAAAKVNHAQTPHRVKVAPSLALVLYAQLDEQSTETCMTACQKIEGVDGKSCKCETKDGEMDLTITGEKKVTAPQILVALKDAGIQAHTMKARTGVKPSATSTKKPS